MKNIRINSKELFSSLLISLKNETNRIKIIRILKSLEKIAGKSSNSAVKSSSTDELYKFCIKHIKDSHIVWAALEAMQYTCSRFEMENISLKISRLAYSKKLKETQRIASFKYLQTLLLNH